MPDVVAAIRDKQTGEERLYPIGPWEDHSDFLWSEGNYACDCNRALFFARAANGEDIDHPCGSTRYHVRIEVDGKEVYADA